MLNLRKENDPKKRPVRWWWGLRIGLLGVAAIIWVRFQSDWPFQKRNLVTQQIAALIGLVLLIWWTFLSRAPQRLRLGVTYVLGAAVLIGALLFRLVGMSGDMAPILEFRWKKREAGAFPRTANAEPGSRPQLASTPGRADFPQFYGPHRDGVLPGPRLETNWTAAPPQMIWRTSVGSGWGGFIIVGATCIGQEQRGDEECVVARSLATGDPVWMHTDTAHYRTIIGGEGPRATPTATSNRVFTLGATGILSCLDLATGKRIWSRDVIKESGGKPPEWGAAGSPLIVEDLVMVHGGEDGGQSIIAFRVVDGVPVWKSGGSPSYASLTAAKLAGVTQVLAFNHGSISSHDPKTGGVFWQQPWGNGNVVCSSPVIVSSNRVLFSSGYGVGSELLEISRQPNGRLASERLWKSIRLKAKFAHLFVREGCVFGLDDGIFACVDLKDGSQRWKEGRYGHGQGLLIDDLYLLMAESGELILLRPTPDGPNELARFRVFNTKTWNPIALSGELLLVRNDREAACLQLKLAPQELPE